MDASLLAAISALWTVGLSAAALFFLWRMVAQMDADSGYLAALGGGLIVLGGSLTAINNLALALVGRPLFVLPINLFSFLSAGFICVAYAIWCGQRVIRAQRRADSVWLLPIGLIVGSQAITAYLVGLPQGPSEFILLLTLTTVANLALNGLCVRQARWQNMRLAQLLFLGYLGTVLGLNVLGHTLDNSFFDLLMVQGMNLLSALFFAAAAWQLSRETRRRLLRAALLG
jgi:hypothetical protein